MSDHAFRCTQLISVPVVLGLANIVVSRWRALFPDEPAAMCPTDKLFMLPGHALSLSSS